VYVCALSIAFPDPTLMVTVFVSAVLLQKENSKSPFVVGKRAGFSVYVLFPKEVSVENQVLFTSLPVNV